MTLVGIMYFTSLQMGRFVPLESSVRRSLACPTRSFSARSVKWPVARPGLGGKMLISFANSYCSYLIISRSISGT